MKGKIIVIEGTDGCGKQTQSILLAQALKVSGLNVKLQSFPNYESASSGPVKIYLSGELCDDAKAFDAYQSSSLFAVDRLCTMQQLKTFLSSGGIVICDRYVQSNMIHQAGKIDDLKQRDKFLKWLNNFEFKNLKLPKADVVLFLDVPVGISKKLAEERKIFKSGTATDIHEKDETHLINAYDAGKYVASKFGWKVISCTESGKMKTIEEIHSLIMKEIKNSGEIKFQI